MKYQILIILFLFSLKTYSQANYRDLILQLNNAKNEYFVSDSSIKNNFDAVPDSLLRIPYYRMAKAFFTEVSYGHKPTYFEFINLKEKLNESRIQAAIYDFACGENLDYLIQRIEAKSADYQAIKPYLPVDSLKNIRENLNFYRWLNRFDLDKFIVINIPSATLKFYQKEEELLTMNVILGTFQNQTPRIATYIDALTVYPYWIATQSIATKELLPLIKKNINYLSKNNFEVLDNKGNIIDPNSIDWSKLSTKNFPYKLRQGTGCDNSLGLLKFNLVNPYSVYMHDTPHDEAHTSLFMKSKRFFSHGCIRLSKPVELTNLIFEKELIDDDFMNICRRGEKPKVMLLPTKIPVFITYHTIELSRSNEILVYQDIYKLIKIEQKPN